jgi:hypothetical protein
VNKFRTTYTGGGHEIFALGLGVGVAVGVACADTLAVIDKTASKRKRPNNRTLCFIVDPPLDSKLVIEYETLLQQFFQLTHEEGRAQDAYPTPSPLHWYYIAVGKASIE